MYRWLNILSIDVAGGAVVGALFFARIFNVMVLPQGLLVLGLTVWIIYTADHLIDARKIKQQASTERHRFHQKYFNVLAVVVMVTAAVVLVQLFFIRKTVFVEGLGLALAIVIYFLFQRFLKFFKELIGAVLYLGGVLLIPITINNDGLTWPQLILIAQFAMTALINLLLFSWFDKHRDEQDKHTSFATMLGDNATRRSLLFLFFVQAVLAGIQFTLANYKPTVILVLMNFVLFLILINRSFFEKNDRYRLLGDAVFWLPVIYILG